MPLPPAARVPGDEFDFHSRPDLSPASVEITKDDSDPEPDADDIFLTPQQGPTQNGAMILDSQRRRSCGSSPCPQGDMAADLRVQRYDGQRVLTWWQGYSGAGVGAGEDVIENSSYRQIAVVHAANGLSADLHEFRLTPQGTALITAYYPVILERHRRAQVRTARSCSTRSCRRSTSRPGCCCSSGTASITSR